MRSLQYSRSVVSSSLKILSRCSAFLRLQTYLNSSPDNFPTTQLTSTNNKPSLLRRPPLLLGSPRSYLRACTLVILAPGQLVYPLLLLPHLLVGEVGLNITHSGQDLLIELRTKVMRRIAKISQSQRRYADTKVLNVRALVGPLDGPSC